MGKTTIEVHGAIALVSLTRGQFAIIDAVDVATVSGSEWFLRNGYAARRADGPRLQETMHQVIFCAALGLSYRDIYTSGRKQIDHKSGNTLDNRRRNLRLATFSQQGANSRVQRSNRTGFKGVIAQRDGRFGAMASREGKRYWCGVHDTAEDAARAYDAKAVELFGEFACTNADLGLV